MLISIANESLIGKRIESPVGRMAAMTRVINSDLAPCFAMDTGSCINRSVIGKYFGLGCYSYIADTSVGRYCTLASRLSIGPFNHPTSWLSAHEFQYRDLSGLYGETLVIEEDRPKGLNVKTVIGSDVWIGDNASVRRGVTIGSGAVVGMGTVVVKDIPPYAIVVGNPGRIVRARFAPDIVDSLLELKWWDRDISALGGIDFSDVNSAISRLRETA